MVLIQSSPLPKIVFTSLFVCVYRVFGENAVCYNSDSLYVGNCAPVRKWWNWQTHHLEGVAPKGVGVQIPPSAPIINRLAAFHSLLQSTERPPHFPARWSHQAACRPDVSSHHD